MRVDLFDEDGEMRKYADVMEDVRRAYFEELMRDRPPLEHAARVSGMSVRVLRIRLENYGVVPAGVHYREAIV